MFKKELIIPALLGLGLYSQCNELNLANNTTMLLALFLILEEQERLEDQECRIKRLERHVDRIECEECHEHDCCCQDRCKCHRDDCGCDDHGAGIEFFRAGRRDRVRCF